MTSPAWFSGPWLISNPPSGTSATAMRLSSRDRTSQRSRSSLRTTGIPNGQPYWTVLMSPPMVFLIFLGQSLQPLSHRFAGPIPCGKKSPPDGYRRPLGTPYPFWYHRKLNPFDSLAPITCNVRRAHGSGGRGTTSVIGGHFTWARPKKKAPREGAPMRLRFRFVFVRTAHARLAYFIGSFEGGTCLLVFRLCNPSPSTQPLGYHSLMPELVQLL